MNRNRSTLRSATALAASLGLALISQSAAANPGLGTPSRVVSPPRGSGAHLGAVSVGQSAGVAPLPAGVERPTRNVLLSIGQGELITLPANISNVWTSNPGAADVYVSNPRQIHLFGKGEGEATIFATAANGMVIYSSNVRVSQNLSSIDKMIKEAMPDAAIHVTMVGQLAVLSGTVKSPDDLSMADNLVKSLLNPGMKVDNGATLKVPVLNRLRMATPLQVNLQVRFAEVSRSLVKTLNSNLTSISNGTGSFKYGISSGRQASSYITNDPNLPLGLGTGVTGYTTDPSAITATNPLGIVAKPGTNVTPLNGVSTLAGMGKFLGLNLLGTLDAGETAGLVTTLAQPNLTAISGETADFLAGGEFPIPLSQGLGSTSIEYKKFGVSLAYTPTVLANGRISLRVRPEVSELSSQGAVSLNGYQIPALTVRRAETTIELGSGQSFMIAGLMSNHAQNTVQKMPGAGDVPILGALFRSTNFQRGETELVIVVTPYLVNPVDANDIKLPTDGYQSPNDLQRVFGNQDSDSKSGAVRPHPTAAPDGATTPRISALDTSAPAQQAESKPSGKRSKAAAADPAPGFSLN